MVDLSGKAPKAWIPSPFSEDEAIVLTNIKIDARTFLAEYYDEMFYRFKLTASDSKNAKGMFLDAYNVIAEKVSIDCGKHPYGKE